jgi:hypothetical protein
MSICAAIRGYLEEIKDKRTLARYDSSKKEICYIEGDTGGIGVFVPPEVMEARERMVDRALKSH